MHWNAEGINSKSDNYSKKLELEHILYEQQVSIYCMQETHLSKDIAFKIRGYQCYRSNRKGRCKGGILTLVKNTINACELLVYMEGE
jgi:exonuclease III